MYNIRGGKTDPAQKLSGSDEELLTLVKKLTRLAPADTDILLEVSHSLPFISSLDGGDAYIDILTKDNRLAVVVAQYSPPDGNFYNHSIVGDIMWRKNEPGVYRTMEIGIPTRELKAIVSDKNIVVRQNVTAITNKVGAVIGALIVERKLRDPLAILAGKKPTEHAADTVNSSKELQRIAEHMNDAVILFDMQGICIYANSHAEHLFQGLEYKDDLVGLPFENLSFGAYTFHDLTGRRHTEHTEIKIGSYNLNVTCNTMWDEEKLSGVILVIKDTTEIRNKETELILKSTVIDEIHHRVKNNLQTIVSLIGLQSNRTHSEDVKAFSRDIISRIYSIGLTHEILAHKGVDSIDIKDMLRRMLCSSMNYIIPETLDLKIEITGDEMSLRSDTATTIAMVVNELIQNSIKHAFIGRTKGRVSLQITKGPIYAGIVITDDGIGFQKNGTGSSMGLKLVKSLVHDKLKGELTITSLGSGTQTHFTFICNKNY